MLSDAGRDRSTQFDSDIAPSGDQWSYLIRANVRVRKDPDGRQLHVTFLGGDVKASEWCRSRPTCVDGNAKHRRIQIEISTCYFTSGSVWRSRDWVSVLRDVPISYPNTGPINFSGHAVKIPIPQVDLALSSHWLCMRSRTMTDRPFMPMKRTPRERHGVANAAESSRRSA